MSLRPSVDLVFKVKSGASAPTGKVMFVLCWGLVKDKFANALALESKRNPHKNWKKANSWLDELAFRMYASGFCMSFE